MSTIIVTHCGKLVAPVGVLDVDTDSLVVTNEGDGRVTITVSEGVVVTDLGDGILQVWRYGGTCPTTAPPTTTGV